MEVEMFKFFRRACMEKTGYKQTVHAGDDDYVIMHDFPTGWKKKVRDNLAWYLMKHVMAFNLIDDSIQPFRSESEKAFLSKEAKKMKYRPDLRKRVADIITPMYYQC